MENVKDEQAPPVINYKEWVQLMVMLLVTSTLFGVVIGTKLMERPAPDGVYSAGEPHYSCATTEPIPQLLMAFADVEDLYHVSPPAYHYRM